MNSNKSSKKKDKRRLRVSPLYYFVKITGILPVLLWLRPHIHRIGTEKKPKGGFLVSANHSTFVDPVVMALSFPFRTIRLLATTDILNTKLKRWFFFRMNCIEVNKENFSVNSLHDVLFYLRHGKVVGIFPEGHAHLGSDAITPFKSGMILMAYKARAPIVPMHIVPPHKKHGRWHAVIGDPVDIYPLCGPIPSAAALENAAQYMRERELELQRWYEERYPQTVTAPVEEKEAVPK